MESTTDEPIRLYHSMEFGGVAEAVDFCQKLVPHVVPPVGRHDGTHESRAVVWFHVPGDGSSKPGRCRLYLSSAAVQAARRAGFTLPFIETVARSALPMGAVLVFGEDYRDPAELTSQGTLRRAGAGRLAAHQVGALEADTILR